MANQKKFASLNLENARQTAAQHTKATQKDVIEERNIEEKNIIENNIDETTIPNQESKNETKLENKIEEPNDEEPKIEGFSDAVMEIFKKEQKSKEAKATIHVTTTDSIRNKLRKIAYDNDLKINQLVAIILEQFIDDFEKRNG